MTHIWCIWVSSKPVLFYYFAFWKEVNNQSFWQIFDQRGHKNCLVGVIVSDLFSDPASGPLKFYYDNERSEFNSIFPFKQPYLECQQGDMLAANN